MSTRPAPSAPPSQPTMSRDAAQPARVALLRHLVLAFLGASPSSALFYAERLHALDAQREHACYLLALALERTKRPREAMHVLRQPVAPMSDSPGTSAMGSTMAAAPPATSHANKRRGAQKPATAAAAAQSLFHSSQSQSLASRSPLPACETTVRCARLYASCASQVGASKDALDALMRANVLSQDLSALATSPAPDEPLHTLSEPWALALEFARAARSADNASTAIRAFSSALENNPWCWEALEGLCALGASVDPTQLFPVRPGSKAVPPSISPDILQPTSPQQSTAPPLRAHHPAPLGPSQSSNAAGLGLFTPNVPGAVAFEHVANNKATPTALGKRSITSFTPSVAQPRHNQDKKATWPPPPREAEPSFDESSVLESSIHRIPAASRFSSVPPPFSFSPAPAAASSSLFTPPVTAVSAPPPVAPAPGVKRSRNVRKEAAVAGPSGSNVAGNPDDASVFANGRRPVKSFPSNGAGGVRRSSRLSREAAAPSEDGTSLAMSRGPSAAASSGANDGAAATREKKRSRNGTHPPASEAGSVDTALSPPPSVLSSPTSTSAPLQSANSIAALIASDPGVLEADVYLTTVTRQFAHALVAFSRFDCKAAIEAVARLPREQMQTSRALLIVARAQFELLNYDKAGTAFSRARAVAPFTFEAMEVYSTLLWHEREKRLPQLSFLAQDLMALHPDHATSWIASGNVFSALERHASALKCFRRAAQLDPRCAYAYTLAGHECVALDETDRALLFFREAVRRDERHYNAWFGIGNVYMQLGKYRLAEYHFRRAVNINPSNAMLVSCVGTVLEKQSRNKDALAMYEKACELAPESPAVRFKRARMWMLLGRLERAEQELLHLVKRVPNEFNVNFLLGKLFLLRGRRSEAVKFFSHAQNIEARCGQAVRELVEQSSKRAANGAASSSRAGRKHPTSLLGGADDDAAVEAEVTALTGVDSSIENSMDIE